MKIILFTILFIFNSLGSALAEFPLTDKETEALKTDTPDKNKTLLDFFKNQKVIIKDNLSSEEEFLKWVCQKSGKSRESIEMLPERVKDLVVEKEGSNKVAVSRLRLSDSYDAILIFGVIINEGSKKANLILSTAFIIPHQKHNIGVFFGNPSRWEMINIKSPSSANNPNNNAPDFGE